MVLAITTNGLKRQLEDWNHIQWKKVHKIVKNLRQRIFRARTLGNFRKLRSLQKLLQKSYANLLLSVRRITQTNQGKATAGIDKEIINTPEQRVNLVNNWKGGNLLPTRRIEIPKSNGKKRPLGIPTVRDRIEQAIIKNSLEPEWEALFEPNSYGFRPGRSCHDAIQQNHVRLCKGADTWVLEADIKGFFDNIAHESILNLIGNFPGRHLIKGWLKAGFVFDGKLNPTEKGTPQGGVISPLLANIGLHGLEEFIKSFRPSYAKRARDNFGVIRYADDFIVTARDKQSLEKLQIQIQQWLSQRGLELSAEKTLITSMEEGFDFLGFNHRHYNGKIIIKPTKQKVLNFCKGIGEKIQRMGSETPETIITEINPILRGFANYYQGQVSKETFCYIDHRVWRYLWKWVKRKHPHKSAKWKINKYLWRLGNVKWNFACEVITREGKKRTISIHRLATTPIKRHVKVKENASPDDPSLKEYWEKRQRTRDKSHWAKDSILYQVAENQNWKCPGCHQSFFNGEEIHTHHIVPVSKGGQYEIDNLQHLHVACHKQVHSKSQSKA